MLFSKSIRQYILSIALLGGISQAVAVGPKSQMPHYSLYIGSLTRTLDKVATSKYTYYALGAAVAAAPFYWAYKYWNRRSEFQPVVDYFKDQSNGMDIYPDSNGQMNCGNFLSATHVKPSDILKNYSSIAVTLKNQVDARKRQYSDFGVATLLTAVSQEIDQVREYLSFLGTYTVFPMMLMKHKQFDSVEKNPSWDFIQTMDALCKHPELFTDEFIAEIEGLNGKGGMLHASFEDTFSKTIIHWPNWKFWQWHIAPRSATASQLYWDLVKRFARLTALQKIINEQQAFIDGSSNKVIEIRYTSGQALSSASSGPVSPQSHVNFANRAVCSDAQIEQLINEIQFKCRTNVFEKVPKLFEELWDSIQNRLGISKVELTNLEQIRMQIPGELDQRILSDMFVSLQFIKGQIDQKRFSQELFDPMINKLKSELNLLLK